MFVADPGFSRQPDLWEPASDKGFSQPQQIFAASYLSILTDGAFGAEYKDVFAFLVLIVILIFRPKGLLGETVREEGA